MNTETFILTGFTFEQSGPYFPPSPVLAYWDIKLIHETNRPSCSNKS